MYSSFLGMNHLGEHFSPIVLLFSPLYALKPSLVWLLSAQLLAYLSAPPLFYLILRPSKNHQQRLQAYLIGILWYLYYPMASAMFFPFHPSLLGVPLILMAFALMQNRSWLRMILVLLFSLLMKENYTLVVVGFGLFLICRRDSRLIGVCLVFGGLLAGYILTGCVLPAFRGDAWVGHLSRIGPTHDLPQKGRYLLKLLLPLGFLPLFHWRSGVIALPAILLNLLTRYPPQYSALFQYDDVTAPLLFLAMINALRHRNYLVQTFTRGKIRAAICALWIMMVILYAPISPLGYIRKNSLAKVPWVSIHAQLQRLDKAYPHRKIHAQSYLAPHLHRTEIDILLSSHGSLAQQDFQPGDLIVLAPHINSWGIEDLKNEMAQLAASARFSLLSNYSPIVVFQVNDVAEESGRKEEVRTDRPIVGH